MKRKILLCLALTLALTVLFAGCEDSSDETLSSEVMTSSSTVESSEIEEETMADFSFLSDTWNIGAVHLDGALVDIYDMDALAQLYGSEFITVNDDGTFIWYNTWISEGTVELLDDSHYILETERAYRLSTDEAGDVVEVEATSFTKEHLLTALDENTVQSDTYDPSTGSVSGDSAPRVYVRKDFTSQYIQNEKISINS